MLREEVTPDEPSLKTLLDLLPEIERLGDREAVVHVDGFRTRKWSYEELLRRASGTAKELQARGLAREDRVLVWAENRPEWVALFWAALSRGITLVPIDFRSSRDFVIRVQEEVGAKLLVHGGSVDPGKVAVPRLDLEVVSRLEGEPKLRPEVSDPDAVVQILYTSGTTGEPKGVVHRHRHLVPTLAPIGREIQKYSHLSRPFQPIRFLELLPLSHVFGQFTGLYVPPLMGGSVVFLKEVHPGAILETIRNQRVSVLVTVPRFLETLRREIERRFDLASRPEIATKGVLGGLRRFFQHRDVHALFGFKFWAILSGGARLAPEEEEFWYRLGFVIVQGYGLTETSALVTTNHPLHPTRGSLGKTVGDQEIRLAPDGEILVRGTNVSQELFGKESRRDVWLHTGDLGEVGPDGTLYYRGRKKDVIIGAEGLNVYPGDVESALRRDPAVKDAVVVGRKRDGGEVIHAVLLLRDREADPGVVVERTNRALEHHQRIREWTIWPGEDFPRTPSTFKIRRYEVARVVDGGSPKRPREPSATETSAARTLIAEKLGRHPDQVRSDQLLAEELGLTSIDRLELLSSLEERYGVELSESVLAGASTVGDLELWVERETDRPGRPEERPPKPEARSPSPLTGVVRWARIAPLRWLRTAFREAVMLPLFRRYLPLVVEGSLEGVDPPVIFAPNHTSNLDTIAVLAALPRKWRDRLAPAMSQDYFRAYLERKGSLRERLSFGIQFWLAVLLVNVFPLPQRTRGVRDALHFAGKLVDSGYSILIFPEGVRSPDGSMHPFRAGVGLMAARLRAPVVPIHLKGLFEVMSVHESWPKPGPVRVRFGRPLRFPENADFREAAEIIEREVRKLERGEVG